MITGKKITELEQLNEIVKDDLLVVLDDSEQSSDKTKKLKADVLLKAMSDRATKYIDGLTFTYVDANNFSISSGSCMGTNNELIHASGFGINVTNTTLHSQQNLHLSTGMKYVFVCKSASSGSSYIRLSTSSDISSVSLDDSNDSVRYIGSVRIAYDGQAFIITPFSQSGTSNVRYVNYEVAYTVFFTTTATEFTPVSISSLVPSTHLQSYLDAGTFYSAPQSPIVGTSSLFFDIRENSVFGGVSLVVFKPTVYVAAGEPGYGFQDSRFVVWNKNKRDSNLYISTQFLGQFNLAYVGVRGYSEEV